MKNALATAALAATILLLGSSLPAQAHADLVKTLPAQEDAITAPPEELRLTFTEGVELAFSDVSVTGSDGAEIEIGDLSLDPEDNKTLIVPIEGGLASGTYSVEWTVVSTDGHKVEGSYDLDIAP